MTCWFKKLRCFRDFFSVFPAWAGVILHETYAYNKLSGVPRVGGGDPNGLFYDVEGVTCSPRGRG